MTTTRSRRARWAAAFVLALFSNAACVSVGKEFDPAHVGDVKTGLARDEIVRWFGEPSRGNKLSLVDSQRGCVKRYRYMFASASGARVLWVDFDWDDRVCDAIFSSRSNEEAAVEGSSAR